MKKDRNRMWAALRIVLAVGILVFVLVHFAHLRDSVNLSDGTLLSGTILIHPTTDVAVEQGKRYARYSYLQIRYSDGKYAVSADGLQLDKGEQVRGKSVRGFVERDGKHRQITAASDLDAFQNPVGRILVGGQPVEFALHDVAIDKDQGYRIDDGLISSVRKMVSGGYPMALAGLGLLGIVPVVAAFRWRMLLQAQDIHITFRRSMDLTLIGLFFNNFMPGLTGGDIVKAYYAAKLTEERKTHAVVTVFLDRVIGMVALGLVAAAAICIGLATSTTAEDSTYRKADYFVAAFVAASVVGTVVFYSRRLRGLGRRFVHVLPGYARVRSTGIAHKAVGTFRSVDSAVFLYRYKKMTLAITLLVSFVAHGAAILSIYCFGQAMNVTQADALKYFIVVPVSFIVSSVPLAPGGWGVGEGVFKLFFGAVGVPGTAAIAMSMVYRFTSALWTLPGGVLFMLQRDRATVEEVEAEMDGELLEDKDAGQDG